MQESGQKGNGSPVKAGPHKKELQERLYRVGFSEEAAKYAIEYVEGFGYLDDARYAANYISLHKAKRSKRSFNISSKPGGYRRNFWVRRF